MVRWYADELGTISNSIRKLDELNKNLLSENRGFTKKELLKMGSLRDKLQRSLGGIKRYEKNTRFNICN